jgi:hypothetical protein
MARRFNCRRVKIHRNYPVAELAVLIGAHKQTIGRWIAAGLPTTDRKRPYLIRGIDFHAFMWTRRQRNTNAGRTNSTASAAAPRNDRPAVWRSIGPAPKQAGR